MFVSFSHRILLSLRDLRCENGIICATLAGRTSYLISVVGAAANGTLAELLAGIDRLPDRESPKLWHAAWGSQGQPLREEPSQGWPLGVSIAPSPQWQCDGLELRC